MSQSSYIKHTRQWQYLVLEPQVNTASFPFGIKVCSVWSASALSTYVFIYSHALNFYLIIKKKLWLVIQSETFLHAPVEWQKNQATAGVLDGVAWHCGVAGSTHPSLGEVQEVVLGPMCWTSTSTVWLGRDRCPWEKGRHVDTSQWEGNWVIWCGGGCREKGLELLTSDGVSICICIYSYISSVENLARSNRASLNCRKIARSNLPC